MQPSVTRVSLLLRLRNPSDAEAWNAFDRKYGELIFRYALRLFRQAADADDVRQLTLMRLSKALPNFEYQPEKGRFRRYLGQIVRSVVIDLSRLGGQRRIDMQALERDIPIYDPAFADPVWEHEWRLHHDRPAMQTVRETFEPKSMEIFDRLAGGETIEVAAGAFNVSTQASHKVKQRVVARVRELIAEFWVGQKPANDDGGAVAGALGRFSRHDGLCRARTT